MAYKNSEDQKAASKRHYLANKVKYLERNKRYRRSIQGFVHTLKESSACVDCKIKYPYYVMDFDHLGDKLDGVNYLMATGRIGALKREIKKCEVVCANCHRKRTYQRSHKITN
jgi:soluble cytochrome b562